MIILFFIIGIVLLIVGVVKWARDYSEGAGSAMAYIGFLLSIFFLVLGINATVKVYHADKTIPAQIEMYEEENKEIEKQIETYIKIYDDKYVNFDFEKDDINTLIAAIPSLGSSNLISKQIETYNENRNMIKALKATQIEYNQSKWWLYFGN